MEALDDILTECDILPNGKWISVIADELHNGPESINEYGNHMFLISGVISVYILSEKTSNIVFRWEFSARPDMYCFDSYPIGFTPEQLEEYLRLHVSLAHSYVCGKEVVDRMEESIRKCSKQIIGELGSYMIEEVQKV